MKPLSISPAQLNISENSILAGLGVPVDKADDYLLDKIRTQIGHCLEICSPEACYAVFTDPHFITSEKVMELEGHTFHLHKMVAGALSKSTSVALFIGTCGSRVEQLSRQLMKERHTLEGLIVDIIGSELAEDVAEIVHQRIYEEMSVSGLKVTNRYSPGYCNWPVSDQQHLFGLLDGNWCGIRLTASSLMIPVKSVSGIVGIGEEVEKKGYACSVCDARYCLYRDKK